MGVISILLGIIAFLVFTGAGIILANTIVEYKTLLSASITSLSSVSNTALVAVVVGIFAFIGLLVCVNLVMGGMNYNKLRRIQKSIKRRV